MNIKHVMSYVSFAGDNLIGHVENWTDNQREHALEARVKALEQRRLQMIKYTDIFNYSDFGMTLKNGFGKCSLFVISANG